MSKMSNYLENALLNHVFRNTAMTSPTTVYVALYTSDPTDDDTGAEVSGGGYERQAVTFSAPSNGVISNSSTIIFPVATANWGTITHIGIKDASTGGNLLVYNAVIQPKTINAGDQVIINAGELTITFD